MGQMHSSLGLIFVHFEDAIRQELSQWSLFAKNIDGQLLLVNYNI